MQWYSATQVAKLLNAATATIIGHCEDGTLGAVNIARKTSKRRRWRISDQHIADFQQSRQNKIAAGDSKTSTSIRKIARPTKDFFAPKGGVLR